MGPCRDLRHSQHDGCGGNHDTNFAAVGRPRRGAVGGGGDQTRTAPLGLQQSQGLGILTPGDVQLGDLPIPDYPNLMVLNDVSVMTVISSCLQDGLDLLP